MPEPISIAPTDVQLDENNPRLSQPNGGQRETLRAIAKLQNRKLLALARDIVQHGIDPSALLIVIQADGEKGRYTALEGNRRIAALKALENPESVVGAVDPVTLAGLRALSKQYQEAPVEQIGCVLFKTRDDANHWIKLRHTGENEGAGLVRWGSDEATRFQARAEDLPLHAQALNFLEENGLSREDRSKVPAASLKRMLGTPEIRRKVGVELQNGTMRLTGDASRVAKALMHLVRGLISGETATKDIYTKEQRAAFAEAIPKNLVVPPGPTNANGAKSHTGASSSKVKSPKAIRRAKERTSLIPNDCSLAVTDPRVREIESELRTLQYMDYPNAAAVLFRVFVELSVDSYILTNGMTPTPDDRLNHKLNAVVTHLVGRSKLSKQQAQPVRQMCSGNSFLTPSVTTFHGYVHNLNSFPQPRDLRAGWNSLQPFMGAIWSK